MIPKICLFVSIAFISVVVNAGGASTVGDGGHLVRCRKESTLLDLYEFNKLNGPGKPHFSDKSIGLFSKILIGIERIQTRFSLTVDQTNYLHQVAFDFVYNNFDPWNSQDPEFNKILYTKKIVMQKKVYHELIKDRCDIEIVAIRPAKGVNPDIDILCPIYGECLLLNQNSFRNLHKDEKACLIVHELLRYLPIPLDNEMTLRQEAAKICIGK